MKKEILDKYEQLKEYIASQKKVAVAFSSGVDSTFLLYVAKEVLGNQVIAITATSASFPQRESKEAKEFCAQHEIRQLVFAVKEMEIPGFAENPTDRCYLCKKEIFSQMLNIAQEQGVSVLVEGSNVDDDGDYRPGMKAIKELGIKSPLRLCGFTKAEIRAMSDYLKLPTWDKPSFACLASRFPYGESITKEKLAMVEAAEEYLMQLGLKQLRVRVHGNVARLEVDEDAFLLFYKKEFREQVDVKLRQIGFSYVALDLAGYRTGSLNETLSKEDLQQGYGFKPNR